MSEFGESYFHKPFSKHGRAHVGLQVMSSACKTYPKLVSYLSPKSLLSGKSKDVTDGNEKLKLKHKELAFLNHKCTASKMPQE